MALDGKTPQTRIFQGTTNGRVAPKPQPPPKRDQILNHSTTSKLENEIDEARDELWARLSAKQPATANDTITNVEESIYDKYNFNRLYNANQQLPIYAAHDEILSTIANNPTVVIEGSTGCGKSTQVM